MQKPSGEGYRGNAKTSSKKKANGTGTVETTQKMFDLKMCLLDFMRITTSGSRQKKSLKEYPAKYMHNRFSDVNMIYFNENMSMTSRCSTIRFAKCPTGNFKPNLMNVLRSPDESQGMYEWIDNSKSLTPSPIARSLNNFSIHNSRALSLTREESAYLFDCSSDECRGKRAPSITDSPISESSMRETTEDDCLYSDCGQTVASNSGAGLDSFCTLCTSSFSFNRCNQCEDSSCSSKCNLSPPNAGRKLMDRIVGANGGGECSSTSGAISSDCDSVQFKR